jgi:hypothetical protein
MEKFRIAQYGMIQMVALAYGILSSGIIVKASKYIADQGLTVPLSFKAVTIYHDYGVFLSIIILGWATFYAYHSSIFSKKNLDESNIVISGLIFSGAFFVLGTFLLLWGLTALFAPRV